ncbi:hypothetical protein C8N46_104338 [Kordia periserrulae]|uniref:Uncharacterized protein n=1 Tax=Kordia periserrulae TaxID=701523 RepID=A0A2T6C048_9FLAO|nr:hypothetical protein C8N46_104338 [Kordia periserrulae]
MSSEKFQRVIQYSKYNIQHQTKNKPTNRQKNYICTTKIES